MAFEVVDLNQHVGSEVRTDVESLLTPEVAARVRDLLCQRGVLVFKQLGLTDEQQVTLARLLGTLREEGEKGIFKVALGANSGSQQDYLKGSFLWHMDGTHDNVPPFASLLTGITLSKTGGQTEFASTYAAYEGLPNEMKERIANLRAVHDFSVSMRRAGIEPTEENLAFWRRVPVKAHNLVWTHKSGRKSLVIGCHASHIEGMDKEEGQALLQDLLERATRPELVYRHEWTPGDLLIWDNTGVLHRVEPYSVDSGRMMHRTTLMGEEAFA